MALSVPQSLLAAGVLPFALSDGTSGIIAPEARKTFDHIVQSKIGSYPLSGLTDTQAHLVLSASKLSLQELEGIWERAERVNVPELPDGCWTQLEMYVALQSVQELERLSLDQMAIHFTGSLPSDLLSEVRRRASYAEAGRRARPQTDHDPMPASPSRCSTGFLRHSLSNATVSTGLDGLHTLAADHALLEVPEGLEVPAFDQASSDPPFIEPRGVRRDHSIRTDTTAGAQRLAGWIQSTCPLVSREPVIEKYQPQPVESSMIERHLARELLIHLRRANPHFKESSHPVSRVLRPSKHAKQKARGTDDWVFEPHEFDLALNETVNRSSDTAIAKELIRMGANVQFWRQPSKSRLGIPRVDPVPVNHTMTAVTHNNADMVSLLALSGVSNQNLADALHQAVEQNRSQMVFTLLQHDVDPNALGGKIFESAVSSQNPAIVALLLRARSTIRLESLTANLLPAVESGQIEVVSMLVCHGADVEFKDGSALRKAVKAQRIDLVLAIMKGAKANSRSKLATSVLRDAFSPTSSRPPSEQRLLVDILLCAGAHGHAVADLLIMVVQARQVDVAKLLIKHGADLEYQDAKALRMTVAAGKDLPLLSILFRGKLNTKVVSTLLDDIPYDSSDERMHDILSLLIKKGAKGRALDKLLLRAVQDQFYRTISLLVRSGANCQMQDFQSLRIAMSKADLKSVNALLTRPQPHSILRLLPLIPNVPTQNHFEISKLLIMTVEHPTHEIDALNNALIATFDRAKRDVDKFLISSVELLIKSGASVECSSGRCLRMAIELDSKEALELLLQHVSNVASLSNAIATCVRQENMGRRLEFMNMLLESGAEGPAVSQALVDAIEEDRKDMDIIRSLLKKADLTFRDGQALSVAMRRSSVNVVSLILGTGKTSFEHRDVASSGLFEKKIKHRYEKLALLLSAGMTQRGLDEALIKELRGAGDAEVVEMLLEHGASWEGTDGEALSVAIKRQPARVLAQLVARRPHIRLLEARIPLAMEIKERQRRQSCLQQLLQGGARGKKISDALLAEVENPEYRSNDIVKLLVQHGARVDYGSFQALKLAVSAPLDDCIVKTLISRSKDSGIVSSLVPLVMQHPAKTRLRLLHMLLDAGAKGDSVHDALIIAVGEGTRSQHTIDLLLRYGASVSYKEAEAWKIASLAGSDTILKSLLDRNPNPDYFESALKLAMQSTATEGDRKFPDRLKSIRTLTQSKAVTPGAVNLPLIQAVQEKDYDLVAHLIKQGADPNFRDGRSVVIATKQRDVSALGLLAQSQIPPSPQTCSRAFAQMLQSKDRWDADPTVIHDIDSHLISGGAKGPAVDKTVLSALHALDATRAGAFKFIALILDFQTPLDVNFAEGKGLCVAVLKARYSVVKHFLSQRPSQKTLRNAFLAIFESQEKEAALVDMAQMFFLHSGKSKVVYFQHEDPSHSALYHTLHRHGDKPNLLQLLLDNGCGVNAKFPWKPNDGAGAEETSALLWLLCQSQEVPTAASVRILLERGVDPNSRTSDSGTTCLIMAASSSKSETVSSLLRAGANPNVQDRADRSPLYYAIMAGSAECMRQLLSHKADVNDEALHVASWRLDFAAVQMLLHHEADPDLVGLVHCDGRTALQNLCRLADVSNNPPDLKQTLQLLCNVTKSLLALNHGKSSLYQALDNASPLKMTTALLAASQRMRESINEPCNLLSRGNLRYSPTAYVRHQKCTGPSGHRNTNMQQRCCTRESCPAPKLERLLHANDCEDHFWDDCAGADQPRGYCNPPGAITLAIANAKAAQAERVRKASEAAEERGRRLRREKEKEAQRKEQARAHREKLRRREAENEVAGNALRERTNVQVDMKKREADLRCRVIGEERKMLRDKQKLVECMTEVVKEAGYAGMKSPRIGGRIVEMIED